MSEHAEHIADRPQEQASQPPEAQPLLDLQPLKDVLDRDWKDETPQQIVIIAANAIYWRTRDAIKQVVALCEKYPGMDGIDGLIDEIEELAPYPPSADAPMKPIPVALTGSAVLGAATTTSTQPYEHPTLNAMHAIDSESAKAYAECGPEEVRALVAKWRDQCKAYSGNMLFAVNRCADELEASLAATPTLRVHPNVDFKSWFCQAHLPMQSHKPGTCVVCNGLKLSRRTLENDDFYKD